MTVLMRDATYVVRDAYRVQRDCHVLIEANPIAGVGRFKAQTNWDVIDTTDCAVIPGLINAHTHLYQSFLKGSEDRIPMVEWCAQVSYPAADVIHTEHWQAHDERLSYAWSLLGALEMIKAGSTCCINMDMTMDAVFQAWLDIDFRGVGAVALMDQWIHDKLLRAPEISRQEALGYIQRWQNTPGESPRIQTVLAPSTPFLASSDLLECT